MQSALQVEHIAVFWNAYTTEALSGGLDDMENLLLRSLKVLQHEIYNC